MHDPKEVEAVRSALESIIDRVPAVDASQSRIKEIRAGWLTEAALTALAPFRAAERDRAAALGAATMTDTTTPAIEALCGRMDEGLFAHPTVLQEARATLTALQSELAAVTAERDAMRARVGALAALIEMIDEAWCGLTQTQLAASAVGVSMANSVRNEGYGLNLKIAIYEARAAIAKATGKQEG